MRKVALLFLLAFGAPGMVAAGSWPTQSASPFPPPIARFQDFRTDGRPCPECPEMVKIPVGSFLLGSLPGSGRADEHGLDGGPVPVRITARLAFAVHEVTRAQFEVFLRANPDLDRATGCAGLVNEAFTPRAGESWRSPGFAQAPDHPAVCVSWSMASAYAQWLSRHTGRHYRLPTEAEWEFAARGGTRTDYWWGDKILPGAVNCRIPVCDHDYAQTAPVDTLPENPYGLRHMLGNVWEWTEDCYDPLAYRKRGPAYPSANVPVAECHRRVIRGGSWQDNPFSLRANNRSGWKPETPLNDIGFRVVREGDEIPL